MGERVYTVDEANALLPALTDALARIQRARRVILAGGERIRRSAPLDGGGAQGKEYWEALSALRREVEGLSEQGIVLRDAEKGLIDFPSRRGDKDAYLCWRLGEDRVAYWHGPESGFAGRKPL